MLKKIDQLKLFGVTYATKLASGPNHLAPPCKTAIGTLLYGSPANPYFQTWDDQGLFTGLGRLPRIAGHQFSSISSTDDPPELGAPYYSALVHEQNGALQSLVACDHDTLATMMCTEPTYSNLRNSLLCQGEDGYHIARFLGTLAPQLAAAGSASRFDTNLFVAEIAQMALLETALAKKNPKWVLATPAVPPPRSWGMNP